MDDATNNGNNKFIEYSSSGQARIEVTDGIPYRWLANSAGPQRYHRSVAVRAERRRCN